MCLCLCVSVHVCVCMCVCVSYLSKYHMGTNVSDLKGSWIGFCCICIHVCVYAYICVCVCMHVYACMCVCVLSSTKHSSSHRCCMEDTVVPHVK